MNEEADKKTVSSVPGKLVVVAIVLFLICLVSLIGYIVAARGHSGLARPLLELSTIAGYLVLPALLIAIVAALVANRKSGDGE